MNTRRQIVTLARLVPMLAMLAGLVGMQPLQSVNATRSPQDKLSPLSAILNPDGSLNLSTGFSGSLDPTGWRMQFSQDGAPIFQPASEPDAPDSPGNIWHALGAGLNGEVNAIAVAGTDVYVGGHFTDAGGVANADRIVRWGAISIPVFLPQVMRE